MYPQARILSLLILCILGLGLLAACADRDRIREEAAQPDAMYERAWNRIQSGNYQEAMQNLRRLEARHPFTPEGKQAQLDQIYVSWLMRERQSTVDEADRFIRENPRSEHLAYAHYMKGLAHYEQHPGPLSRWFGLDMARRDQSSAEQSFAAFQELVQRFPESPYADDARQRMVSLRNRLARHEWHVADYYLRREAYMAAVGRSTRILEELQPTPITPYALDIMAQSYEALGETELAEISRTVRDTNYPDHREGATPRPPE